MSGVDDIVHIILVHDHRFIDRWLDIVKVLDYAALTESICSPNPKTR